MHTGSFPMSVHGGIEQKRYIFSQHCFCKINERYPKTDTTKCNSIALCELKWLWLWTCVNIFIFFSFVFSPNQTWSIHNMNHSPRYEHCNLNMFHVRIFVRACVGYLFVPCSFENWIRSSVWPKITFLSVCHSACVWYTLPLKYCCRQFHVCGHQINAQIIRFIRMTTHRVMLYGSECIQNASHVFNEIVCKRLHCGSKTNINDNNNNNNCTQHQ